MHAQAQLIEGFYRAFQKLDGDAMVACYHDEISFSDPVFPLLEGKKAGAMWKMLCSRATGFELNFNGVSADDKTGRARWQASYDFSLTGRRVHNRIAAEFEFRDGLIWRHRDHFDFWKWSRMALGAPGLLLGWTPLLRGKVRAQAANNLEGFVAWLVATDGAATVAVTHQLGDHPQTLAAPDCINLGLGHPSPSLLPATAMAEAASTAIARDRLLLQYGVVRGHRGFRASLAEFLNDHGATDASADKLFVTGGTSTALAFVAQALARPGQRVICSDPTYFLARGIFEAHGLEVVGVPVTGQGMSIDAVSRVLTQDDGQVALIYCMPTFHNPCGVTMPDAERRALVEVARRHNVVVIADEPYNLLSYRGTAPASLATLDNGSGRVLSLGSFSKILGPGLRLGWAEAAEPLLARLESHGALQSGGGLNPIVAAVVHELIDSGFQAKHVARLCQRYSHNAKVLAANLGELVPTARFAEAAGGYFTWVDLGDGISTSALLEAARAAGVAYTPGTRCSLSGMFDHCLRLSLSFYEADEIELGIQRLASCFAA